ncbi:hypothetical protein RCOM_0623850 [Ricinus communis]|uniref:U1-type domain-containing protein n=1 Tax=Ricinus communis TaxID=3988 RepID=B9STT6_RICCO|nr:hypothetical protein RCOM_0623850 [Ricinus communis]|eukprot:XP_002529405.1 uncharacterized protein LOC8264842 [Ricinus communis]
MEFRFRAADSRPPEYFFHPSSSGTAYFSEHAFRANYHVIDSTQDSDLMRNEMLHREMEKDRIREQIIMEEMTMRRRILEAEVRREMMIEREIAMRAVGGYNDDSYEETLEPTILAPQFHFMNQLNNRRVEDRPAFPGRGFLDHSPRRLSEAWAGPDVNAAKENSKGKVVVLAKPDPNLFGVKRKAATPPVGGTHELPCTVLKKKPKEEWSCALCRVSATSEQGLNNHLRGKKHKAKEARLRANKMAKTPCSRPLPKKSLRQTKLTVSTADLELEPEAEAESVQVDKNDDDTDKKMGNKVAENNNDKLQVQKNGSVKSKKKNVVKKVLKEERTAEFRMKKKFKFWCEMCRIGAYSAVVMEAHEKGKKHLAQLQELGENGEVAVVASSSEASMKAKDAEAVAENAEEQMIENAINNGKNKGNLCR